MDGVGLDVVRQSPPAGVALTQLELGALAYLDEDPDVQAVHHRERQVEVEEGRHQLEHGILGILRVAHVGGHGPDAPVGEVVPADDGDDPQAADHPHHGDHAEGPATGALVQVLERRPDGPVPVEAEDEEVEDGGGGGGIVDAYPDLADGHAEGPVPGEDVDGRDGHDDQPDDQVRHGQGYDEHVADLKHVIAFSHQ